MTLQNVIAGMANNEIDEKIAGYLDYLASEGLVKKVTNFHVFIAKYLVKELNSHHPGHGDQLLNSIKTHIEKKLHLIYKHTLSVKNVIKVGNHVQEFKNISRGAQSTVIALGKAPDRLSTLIKNIIRHVPSNTLIIPEKASHSLNHILVPVDLSESSKKLMEEAISIRSAIGRDVKITCFHAFDMPNYKPFYTLGTEERLHKQLKSNYQEALDKFVAQFTSEGVPGINKVLVEEAVTRPSRYILDYINKNDVDLVIMGASSHSFFEWFLGSTVEKVITKNDKVPLLVIK